MESDELQASGCTAMQASVECSITVMDPVFSPIRILEKKIYYATVIPDNHDVLILS